MILKIHPAIGIARLGNSPDAFYLAPENEGDLPIVCDPEGVPQRDTQGKDQSVRKFVDDQGRVLRQAARFRVFVYDESQPEGRELKIGDTIRTDRMPSGSITGQIVEAKVKDIQWTVYLANKKSVWYQFQETQGEHGYDANHP
ncbi:MAG: LodA/GoxA family CTQ-dependent oxidase, partial [Verrucomicrobiales bacterium]|nr:LodA/GoxA family CTQ-dependent oxidase [Verrucomicrobiales bacterium]